jgi:hypothetical protein
MDKLAARWKIDTTMPKRAGCRVSVDAGIAHRLWPLSRNSAASLILSGLEGVAPTVGRLLVGSPLSSEDLLLLLKEEEESRYNGRHSNDSEEVESSA